MLRVVGDLDLASDDVVIFELPAFDRVRRFVTATVLGQEGGTS
jgi:hypothetical protein